MPSGWRASRNLAEKRDELMELPETWMEGARDMCARTAASLGVALRRGLSAAHDHP